MATISPISKFFSSIRWRIVLGYLAIILAAFTLLRYAVVHIVDDYMISKQVSGYLTRVERMAVEAEPLLRTGNADNLYAFVQKNAADVNGRVLITNHNGIVQMDSTSSFNGMRLTLSELTNVLSGSKTSDYGLHLLPTQRNTEALYGTGFFETLRRWVQQDIPRFFHLRPYEPVGESVAYCAAPIVDSQGVNGALIFSVSIQNAVDKMAAIRFQMTAMAVGIAIAAGLLSLMFSNAILHPVRNLIRGIRKVAQGDFSHRVPARGRSEFSLLGHMFNTMSMRLEKLDHMRNEFVSNASHELKTPLSGIKILSENLLAQSPMDEVLAREFLTDINSEVDRMSTLVGDLLVLSKMDSDLFVFDEQPVDLDSLAQEVVSKMDLLAARKSITLETTGLEPVEIEGRRASLYQMMLNLIDNAIKYTPEGGTVRVSVRKGNAEGIFTVSDTGFGIDPESIPFLFDRFFRIDKARSRQTGGTGLGLSIVKKIVQQHQGIIEVQSEPDAGTIMTVHLPLSQNRLAKKA